MAAESGRDINRQSDLAVMDANEYKQKRRLERILDAMDKIEEQANKAWDEFVHGQINHDAKNIMIQRAVKEAIRESYNLLIEHQRTAESSNGEEPPERYWINTSGDPLGAIRQQDGDTIWIRDLRDFLETREIYREQWEERVKPRNKPPRTEVKTREQSVPEEISWQAALRLKEFLNREHGMELTFEAIEVEEHAEPW